MKQSQPSAEDVARALNNSRGFGFALSPEEGQDLYEISLDALRDAYAVLALFDGVQNVPK